jgi:hypothetical protein
VDVGVTYGELIKEQGQRATEPVTLDALRDKLFSVDEAKFVEWFDRMEARYTELMEQYGDVDKVRRRMPQENITIDNPPRQIQEALKTTAESLVFSPDSLAKQLDHHPEITSAEYISVMNKIKDCTGKTIFPEGSHRAVLLVVDGQAYKVVLKTTKTRSEIYMLSLHRLNDDSLEAFLKSHGIQLEMFLKSTGKK